MENKLRCERCGETFDQHWKVGHPCVGFLHDPEKKLVLKSKASPSIKEPGKFPVSGCSRCGDSFDEHSIPGHECKGFKTWVPYKVPNKSYVPEFKPLDTYGNWITVSNLDMSPETGKETRKALLAQIDEMIPDTDPYRRCIIFTNMKNIQDLTTTISWRYRPSLRIIQNEIDEISQTLHSVREQIEYRIKGYPQCTGTDQGFTHFYVEKQVWYQWVRASAWMFISTARAQAWIEKQQTKEVQTNDSYNL